MLKFCECIYAVKLCQTTILQKSASSKDFETTTNTEDVTNADLLSLFKIYMNEKIDGIQRNFYHKTQPSQKGKRKFFQI